jgi:hypothetical protein
LVHEFAIQPSKFADWIIETVSIAQVPKEAEVCEVFLPMSNVNNLMENPSVFLHRILSSQTQFAESQCLHAFWMLVEWARQLGSL